MVRIISTAHLGGSFDLGSEVADGIDYREVPRPYDYERDLPESARGTNQRLVLAVRKPSPPVAKKVDRIEPDNLPELDI